MAGLLAAAGTCMLPGSLETRSVAMIYGAGGIVGLAAGLFTTSSWALGADKRRPWRPGVTWASPTSPEPGRG